MSQIVDLTADMYDELMLKFVRKAQMKHYNDHFPIADIVPPPDGFLERLNEEHIMEMARSLRMDGQILPILINAKNQTIIDGIVHYYAAVFLGWAYIKVELLEP